MNLDGASIQIFPDGFRLPFSHTALPILADRLVESTKQDRTVLFTCGAHVVRRGNAPLLVDLMRCGLLSHLALNGAGAIHDFELALVGKTCENVARYISRGQFGLWEETGRINDAAGEAYLEGMGLGEAIGRMIHEERFPHRETSLLAAGYRLRVSCYGSRGDCTGYHPPTREFRWRRNGSCLPHRFPDSSPNAH